MDQEGIRALVDDLDEAVSKENAKAGLYQYGGDGDGSWVRATRNGYLRLGIEFLKAGLTPSESASAKTMVDVDLQYLVDGDSTINFTSFELVDELNNEPVEETWGDKAFIYTVIGILIAIPILALFGLVTLVRMLI